MQKGNLDVRKAPSDKAANEAMSNRNGIHLMSHNKQWEGPSEL